MAYIELTNITYQYPFTKANALTDVSYRFEKGRFYGLIGENGGGKTTLCNLIRGLIPHFYNGKLTGEARIGGTDVRAWDMSALSTQIGYVFQNPFTQISGIRETVFEEIALSLENMGRPKSEIIERVVGVASLLGIEALLDKSPFKLSGGQRQRVAFASILVMDAEMLVIDEPTSQLDPQGAEDVFAIIDMLRVRGKTIVLVEHKVHLIARYCDEVLVLREGRIVLSGATAQVLTDARLAACGVSAPAVVGFANALSDAGYPLAATPVTVGEAAALVEQRWAQCR